MKDYKKGMFYVGSYSDYIYIMELDREKEKLCILNRIDHCNKPSYLCKLPGKNYLYANNEISNGLGGVSSFDIKDKHTPKLINRISFNASGPCHISISQDQQSLLSASYAEGKIYVNPINKDGSLNGFTSVIRHENGDILRKGIVPSSQSQARAHFILQISGTKYVLVTDLGTDRVYVYILERGNLIPHSFLKTVSGSGPRNLEVHPSGSTIYLVNELNNTVNVLYFNKETGELNSIQQLTTLPYDYKGASYSSAIHISKNGHFLYTANRGFDSIAVFSVNETDHSLTSTGYMPLPHKTPRDFAIDPSGKLLLVGNMDTDSVTLCRISPATGIPEVLNHTFGIEKPSCFVFLD
ncbi:MAG: lactonase family protein [Ruminiclostridium sp.]|nr:lactonase family protein [Ruminiclostridium sp.]